MIPYKNYLFQTIFKRHKTFNSKFIKKFFSLLITFNFFMKRISSTAFTIFGFFLFVVHLTSCTKKIETIKTVTITDTLNCAVDTGFVLKTTNWSYFSYSTLAVVQPGTTTYYNQNEMLVGMGQNYRLGGRLQTTKEFNITGKVLYYKWKVQSGGQFAGIVPQLKYDPNTTDSDPSVQNVDFILHSTSSSYNGSIKVQDNTWYFTRIAAVPGTNNYECTTAINNYSNLSGNIIGSKTTPVYTKSGYVAIRMGDSFAGTGSNFTLAECKIASR